MSPSGGDATRSQIRGSNLLLAGQAVAAVVNLVTQVLIVRYLSKSDYGAIAYGLSIAVVAEAVAGFGMRRGVSRFMPLYEERGQLAQTAGTLVLGVTTVTTFGLLTVVAIVGFRGSLSGSFADDATATTVIALLALIAPTAALGALLDGVFAVYGRPRSIALRKYVLTPMSRLLAIAVLIATGQGVVLLAIAYVATGMLGLVVYIPLLVGVLREHELLPWIRPGAMKVPMRELFRFCAPLFSDDVAGVFLVAGSGIALGVLSSSVEVATLRAVLPVALTMTYVLSSFELLLVPLATRLYARKEREELNRLYWLTAIWTAVLAFPIFIVCAGLAKPVTVLLFGHAYAGAAPVLAVLACGEFFNTAAGHNSQVLAVFHRVRFLVVMNLAAVAIDIALLLLLVPTHGATGAAIATALTFVVLNVLRQVGIGRHTTINAFDRSAIVPAIAICATTAVVLAADLLGPPLFVRIALVAIAIATVFAVVRRRLGLLEFFPRLARIPAVGRLAGVELGQASDGV